MFHVFTCLYKGIVHTMLTLPKHLCHFLLYFSKEFWYRWGVGKIWKYRLHGKVICLMSLSKKNQEQNLLGWPVSFSFSLSLPISLLTLPFSPVSLQLCSLLWPAFSISGTLMYPWFFSSSSFYLQLFNLSLSTNTCLSFTHSSSKKPVLTTFLSPPLWI